MGSGGKTTLMFQLARDFKSRVILTTTTHMALDQLKGADRHIEVNDPGDVPDSNWDMVGDVIIFTGPPVETNRVGSPDPASLMKILQLADAWDCPLLIESDGARKLPLKAPAEHEPPIPDFADTVITVIGLSGLGKPLNEKWVHRPELFSRIADLKIGGEIHSSHLVSALVSDQGGLKNIPAGAQKILMINQIDSFPNWKTFYDHLDYLLSCYHKIAFGVLEDQMFLEIHHRTAGVILAGGGSTRFGEPKQLLDWKGIPLVKHVSGIALDAGLSPVIVVTGSEGEQVSEVLGEGVNTVHNPDWHKGQSTSVRVGVESLPADVGGVVFMLVDQPLIPPDLIRLLRRTHARSQAGIICPRVGDEAGNPVLFDRSVFIELMQLNGDQGGKAIFKNHKPRFVHWDDRNVQEDIDSPDDFRRISEISG